MEHKDTNPEPGALPAPAHAGRVDLADVAATLGNINGRLYDLAGALGGGDVADELEALARALSECAADVERARKRANAHAHALGVIALFAGHVQSEDYGDWNAGTLDDVLDVINAQLDDVREQTQAAG